MSTDVMIVAPCKTIDRAGMEFAEWLSDAAEDFTIRYCALEPSEENIAGLRRFAEAGEPAAVAILVEMGDMTNDGQDVDPDLDGVELFISY